MEHDESMRVRKRIRPALEIVLACIAEDKRCSVDDLSVEVTSAVEGFGLECYRMRDEDARVPEERPTKPTMESAIGTMIADSIRTDHAALAPPPIPSDFFAPDESETPVRRPQRKSKKSPPPQGE